MNKRAGMFCLRYGNWVSECIKDNLCEYMTPDGPECWTCGWGAWNVTVKGLPIGDMPQPLSPDYTVEGGKELPTCSHGSKFILWRKDFERPEDEWIKVLQEENCDCPLPCLGEGSGSIQTLTRGYCNTSSKVNKDV